MRSGISNVVSWCDIIMVGFFKVYIGFVFVCFVGIVILSGILLLGYVRYRMLIGNELLVCVLEMLVFRFVD